MLKVLTGQYLQNQSRSCTNNHLVCIITVTDLWVLRPVFIVDLLGDLPYDSNSFRQGFVLRI